MLFKHKKTGKLYRHMAFATDATNSRDGLNVVVYCEEDNPQSVFVRETSEFFDKFEAEPIRACKCFTDEQRRLCRDKGGCVMIEAPNAK